MVVSAGQGAPAVWRMRSNGIPAWLGDPPNRPLGALEQTEDDLVLPHQQRADVPDRLVRPAQLRRARRRPGVEGGDRRLVDVGPEALGGELPVPSMAARVGAPFER